MGGGNGGRGGRSQPGDMLEAIEAALDQLGLRLDARQTQVDTIVIEHAERPSGN
jgi:uncharacterized protein (TIGR03435 family)